MYYTLDWHTEYRLLLIRLHGEVTTETLQALLQAVQQRNEGALIVHYMLDIRDVASLPPDVESYRRVLGNGTCKSIQSMIVVSHNSMLNYIADIVLTALGVRHWSASSLREAARMLSHHHPEIPEQALVRAVLDVDS